jgi:hypothetical protein
MNSSVLIKARALSKEDKSRFEKIAKDADILEYMHFIAHYGLLEPSIVNDGGRLQDSGIPVNNDEMTYKKLKLVFGLPEATELLKEQPRWIEKSFTNSDPRFFYSSRKTANIVSMVIIGLKECEAFVSYISNLQKTGVDPTMLEKAEKRSSKAFTDNNFATLKSSGAI